MELKSGDWVRTDSGEVGRVVQISRLTVFVTVPVAGKEDRVAAYLQSQLKKIAPPDRDKDAR